MGPYSLRRKSCWLSFSQVDGSQLSNTPFKGYLQLAIEGSYLMLYKIAETIISAYMSFLN